MSKKAELNSYFPLVYSNFHVLWLKVNCNCRHALSHCRRKLWHGLTIFRVNKNMRKATNNTCLPASSLKYANFIGYARFPNLGDRKASFDDGWERNGFMKIGRAGYYQSNRRSRREWLEITFFDQIVIDSSVNIMVEYGIVDMTILIIIRPTSLDR